MKKFSLIILALVFMFSSATNFVNVCSTFNVEKCHKKYNDCRLKSGSIVIESSKIIISVPNDMHCANNFHNEPPEHHVKFISSTSRSYPQSDNSRIVRSLNPSNAPPLA